MQQEISVNSELEIPEDMKDIICPITTEIMIDPVIIESGNTYEREAILKWLEKNNTDPLTNEILKHKFVTPNRTVKKMITSFLDKQKETLSLIQENQALQEELKKLKVTVITQKQSFAQNPFTIHNSSLKSALKAELITSQQLEKQNQLTKALLSGNFELVKILEDQGASFSYPDKDGFLPWHYPLVAAVYGCNLELIRYTEEKLKGGAGIQWQRVDIKEFAKILDNQIPKPLSQNPTYGELGNWYIEHQNKWWCIAYDQKVLKDMNCTGWAHGDSWSINGRTWYLTEGCGIKDHHISKGYIDDPYNHEVRLYYPSVKVHEAVVTAIREHLNDLKDYVELRVEQSQNFQYFYSEETHANDNCRIS